MTVRSTLEKTIQSNIEADLGAEPDLLILRNSIGQAEYFNDDGKSYRVPYGLGKGSPDLVGLLRIEALPSDGPWAARCVVPTAIWFCLEVKVPGEEATSEQSHVHAIWRRFGAFVEVVHSVSEARAALERARSLFR